MKIHRASIFIFLMLITTLSAKRLPVNQLSGDSGDLHSVGDVLPRTNIPLHEIPLIGKFSSVDVGTYIDDVICKIEDNAGSPTELYYHSDRQFNARGLTDSNGDIVELYAYSVYGKQTVMDSTGNSLLATGNSNQYGFTGRYFDEETGLWYFRARYFDDEMGRFVSRDPLGYVDGMSLYGGYFASGFGLDPSGTNLFEGIHLLSFEKKIINKGGLGTFKDKQGKVHIEFRSKKIELEAEVFTCEENWKVYFTQDIVESRTTVTSPQLQKPVVKTRGPNEHDFRTDKIPVPILKITGVKFSDMPSDTFELAVLGKNGIKELTIKRKSKYKAWLLAESDSEIRSLKYFVWSIDIDITADLVNRKSNIRKQGLKIEEEGEGFGGSYPSPNPADWKKLQ